MKRTCRRCMTTKARAEIEISRSQFGGLKAIYDLKGLGANLPGSKLTPSDFVIKQREKF